MRIIGILLLAIFFVSCGNNSEETFVEEQNYSAPAPQYIVVRDSQSGERHYQFFDGNMTQMEVVEAVENGSKQKWNNVGSSHIMGNGRTSNGSVRFAPEADNESSFIQTRRGAFSADGAAAYNYCYTPQHIYYGNFTYNHCYPQNYGYNGYRYVPSYLWQNTYYYYRPFYNWNNWNYGGPNYYFYRWGF